MPGLSDPYKSMSVAGPEQVGISGVEGNGELDSQSLRANGQESKYVNVNRFGFVRCCLILDAIRAEREKAARCPPQAIPNQEVIGLGGAEISL
jgi:hypothetical protein